MKWKVVVHRPFGPRAPCELCLKIIPAGEPRDKLWNELMKADGSKNGPGLWVHPACGRDMIAAAEEVEEEIRLPLFED